MADFSGKIGTPTDGFTLKVEYSYTQSIANNNSVINSIKGYCKKNNSSYYPYNSSKSATIKIERLDDSNNWVTVKTLNDSSSYSFSGVSTSTYLEFVSGSNITIPHKSDGSQQLRITFEVDGKLSSYYPKGSISSTQTLTTIHRASVPTLSASSVAMGSSVTITTNRASSSFTHTLTYKFGNASGTIATGVGTSYAWTPPLSLANQIPNATSGTCTITCQTYNGSTLIGTKTINLTLTVPSNVVPSISSIGLSAGNSVVPSSWGVYVQGKSTLKVVTSASGSYGSSITSYKITGIDNNTYYSSNFTSSILQIAGTRTITVTVTDSRGRTAIKTTTYTCVAYSNPTISVATVTRCNADGTDNEEGEYVKYSFTANVAPVSNKNTYLYRLGYKNSTSSSYTYITISNSSYTLSKNNIVIDGVTFSIDNSYDFQFNVTDYFTSSVIVRNVGTGFTLMDFNASGKAMAIGKVSEAQSNEKLLEIAFPIKSSENIAWNTAGISGDDYNNYKKSGMYYMTSNCTNAPENLSYIKLFVNGVEGGQDIVQMAISVSHDKVFFRRCVNGNWSSWQPILNSTDVINNLTTENSVKPLSASQGKYLYENTQNKITKYGGANPINPNTTTDSLILTNHSNCPTTSYWYISTYFYSNLNSSRCQIAYGYIENRIFYRYNYFETGWGSWQEVSVGQKPVSLYDNSTGTSGTVTLSQTSANFNWLEIIYRNNDGFTASVKIFAPNGKKAILQGNYTDSSGVWLKNKTVQISGTSITSLGCTETKITSSGFNSFSGSTSNISIVKVTGNL